MSGRDNYYSFGFSSGSGSHKNPSQSGGYSNNIYSPRMTQDQFLSFPTSTPMIWDEKFFEDRHYDRVTPCPKLTLGFCRIDRQPDPITREGYARAVRDHATFQEQSYSSSSRQQTEIGEDSTRSRIHISNYHPQSPAMTEPQEKYFTPTRSRPRTSYQVLLLQNKEIRE